MIRITVPQTGQAALCRPIFALLPTWFGRLEANQHYLDYIDANPTYIAYADKQAVGFMALAHHYPHAVEIYVMAVHPEHHRRGIGRELVEAAERDLRAGGTRFLQVKTLGEAHPDAGYALTRQFYMGIGFIPLEEHEDYWGAGTPALQLIKTL